MLHLFLSSDFSAAEFKQQKSNCDFVQSNSSHLKKASQLKQLFQEERCYWSGRDGKAT